MGNVVKRNYGIKNLDFLHVKKYSYEVSYVSMHCFWRWQNKGCQVVLKAEITKLLQTVLLYMSLMINSPHHFYVMYMYKVP